MNYLEAYIVNVKAAKGVSMKSSLENKQQLHKRTTT